MRQLNFELAGLRVCHNQFDLPLHFRHNLLSLALLFLLLTVPDLGTLDPVLVSLQPLPSWCSQRQSGQKTKLHLVELHSAREPDTREGDVQRGQCVRCSPGLNLWASSTKSLCRTLLGDTIAATLAALPRLPPLLLPSLLTVPPWLGWLSSCCITRLGEGRPNLLVTAIPLFS